MTAKKPDIKQLRSKLKGLVNKLKPFSFIAFLVFVGMIYGFLIVKVSTLSSAEPSDIAVSKQINSARLPKIDQNVVQQLNSLEDNSVSVKTLFDEARSNPFQ